MKFDNLSGIVRAVRQIRDNVFRGTLLPAIELLRGLVGATGSQRLAGELNALSDNYGYMLDYASQGLDDPQREAMLNGMKEKALSLADRCEVALAQPLSTHLFFTRRKTPGNLSVADALQAYRVELNKCVLLRSVDKSSRDNNALKAAIMRCEHCESTLFNSVWTAFPLTADEAEQIECAVLDNDLPEHARCLLIAALLLGSAKFYDERKLLLLLRAYRQSSSPAIQLRALCNALLVMCVHNRRARLSEAVGLELDAAAQCPAFASDTELVQMRLAHSRNTGNIARKLNDELLPHLKKISPEILKKVRDSGGADLADFDENPQWQQWLDESGVTRKLELFNEIQMEGGDVFISSFSRLKNYPFFNTISNWFMPFHTGHSVLLGDDCEPEPLSVLMAEMDPLCDSDKYSMALSLATLPAAQREAMTSQLQSGLGQVRELKAEREADNPRSVRDAMINSHLQGLYRFFTLFSRQSEFAPVFASGLDMMQVEMLRRFVDKPATQTFMAEFYFKNGLYYEAVVHYNHLLSLPGPTSAVVWQKLGFSHQKLRHFAKAVECYRHYEIASGSDVWTLRHLAACHRSLGELQHAEECYVKALELAPDDVALCLNAGHCRLEQGRVEDALKLYFRADFLDGAGDRAWRPIAWCCFLKGDYDRAEEYYTRIEQRSTPTATDLLNHGHLMMATGNMPKAVELYRKSSELAGESGKTLAQNVEADVKHLTEKGINEADVWLAVDSATRK